MSVTIAPNDANIVYSPHNWNRTATRALTINPGAYFRAAFLGSMTSLTMNFDVTNINSTPPQVSWRIDGGSWQSAKVAATLAVTMPTNVTWTKHFIEVVVKGTSGIGSRWNLPSVNGVYFTGFTASDGVTTAPIPRKPLSIMVCGDSITEGLRTLAGTATDYVDDSDSKLSWAYMLGEKLGAEIGMVGFSSQGWISPGAGFVPTFQNAWNYIYNGTARATVDPVEPDMIIINHGINDQTDPSVAATSTLNAMLTAYPNALIVLVTPFNGKWGTELSGVVAAINSTRLSYVDSAGWRTPQDVTDGTHNTGYINAASIAPKLATSVKAILDQSSTGTASNRWIKTTAGLVAMS